MSKSTSSAARWRLTFWVWQSGLWRAALDSHTPIKALLPTYIRNTFKNSNKYILAIFTNTTWICLDISSKALLPAAQLFQPTPHCWRHVIRTPCYTCVFSSILILYMATPTHIRSASNQTLLTDVH